MAAINKGRRISKEEVDTIVDKLTKQPSGGPPTTPGYQDCGAGGGAHHCIGDFECSKPFFCHDIHLNE